MKQSSRLAAELGDEILERSLNSVSPVWTLPQLLWVKENEPDVWQRAKMFLFAKDYVRLRLTGVYATDRIDALGSMLFDGIEQEWSDLFCGAVGLDVSDLPPVASPEDIIGTVTREAAEQTGLAEGTPVIAGATDTVLEVFGAGAIDCGQATVKLATAGRICVISDRPHRDPNLFNYPHVITGRWYPGTGTKSCAASLRWFRQTFGGQESDVARLTGRTTYEILDEAAQQVQVGSEGLLFHPYLLGELSPYNDPNLRGSFTGITPRHSKAHFVRSVLEGVAFSLLDSVHVLEQHGLQFDEARIIGGGGRSRVWSQIVADVLGCTLEIPMIDDSSFGGAMLAGVGVGIFADHVEAVERCVRVVGRVLPDPKNHEKYQKLFSVYREIHDNLAETYSKLARFIEMDGGPSITED